MKKWDSTDGILQKSLIFWKITLAKKGMIWYINKDGFKNHNTHMPDCARTVPERVAGVSVWRKNREEEM